MQRQLTKEALLLLLVSSLATEAVGQERGSALATVPEYSDDPSGWVRVEVAIFADSNAAALDAEIWEHAPTLRYPESRRWLTRYDEIKALMDEWGESAVTVNADGSIDVVPETVSEPVVEAAQASGEWFVDVELAGESVEENTGDTPLGVGDDKQIAADSILSIDELEALNGSHTSPSVGPSSNGSQVSMEALLTEIDTDSNDDITIAEEIAEGDSTIAVNTEVLEDNVDTVAIDAVDIFNTGDMTGANAQFGSMTSAFPDNSSLPGSDINWLGGYAVDQTTVQDTDTIAPEEAPPALPTPYQVLTLEMLKQGLDKLQQQADRAPITALAWLQAPGDGGHPVVLDAWHQASEFPVIQGTLTFTRDGEPAITVDLWLNTAGDYLPPRFEAIETPSLPRRVLVIETPPTDQEPVQVSDLPEFIDLRTGLNTDSSESSVDESNATIDAAQEASSPYRHAIAVSEQRDIREGHVRYIDHPALQVVATWRELSFKEVYEIGESQRIRRDIDSLTRTLTAAPKTWVPRPPADPESTDTIAP